MRVMGPEAPAAAGTAVRLVPEPAENEAAGTPPNSTPVTPVRLVPVMVTVLPAAALLGEKPLMVGAGSTVKLGVARALVLAVPEALVTVMGPVVAPAGTETVAWVPPEFTAKPLAAVPLKLTLVRPLRLVPEMVTRVPGVPLVGLKPLMAGGPTLVLKRTLRVLPLPLP